MKVFKFGGASVKDAEAVRNVARILKDYKEQKVLMIVSAMGKTTNALERVLNAYYYNNNEEKEALKELVDFHVNICIALFGKSNESTEEIKKDLEDIPRLIEEHRSKSYDFIYDQVVSLGEWASTKIVADFLDANDLPTHWIDAMECVKTDNVYRESTVNWQKTEKDLPQKILPLFETKNFVMTQGFTGASDEGFVTTLGREGSDYSAAIFSYCLNAESMTVWKDVPGILNADPRKFKNVSKLEKISYKEATEMTYYGANVIHPKTIKPLQNKNIPLHVKSFVKPEDAGTIISNLFEENYPPIVMIEPNQVLLKISTKDFSFVAEHHLSDLFACFAQHRIKVNMMRNTAISFTVCITTHRPERLLAMLDDIKNAFDVESTEDLELITIRYFNEEVLNKLKLGKIVLLEERLKNTVQMVVKNIAIPERI